VRSCKKGDNIQLQQRRRVEDDLAVKAASILARVEFGRRLESLGHQIGYVLPKGTSSPIIGTTACDIAAQGGKPAFAIVEKHHFKVTTSVIANTEDALCLRRDKQRTKGEECASLGWCHVKRRCCKGAAIAPL